VSFELGYSHRLYSHPFRIWDKSLLERVFSEQYEKSDDEWKIVLENADDKKSYRYFKKEHVDKAEVRRKVESIPFKERKKRNNVEAFMLQYGFHIRNNKTEYRKLFKYGLQAIVRCAWIVFSGLTTN
jgi:hypothetical protein